MAKKQKTNAPKALSPEQYLKEKGRSLPIVKCTVNKDWQNTGVAMVTVTRKHKQDSYTMGVYLIDTYCLGLTYTYHLFSMKRADYDSFLEKFENDEDRIDIEYAEAHNLVYGAIDFAEVAGIEPHKNFRVTQYILEEDTDDIPLIEYDFGRNGQHHLVANDKLEASKYLPLLQEHLGNKFTYHIADEEDDDFKEDDDFDRAELLDRMEALMKKGHDIPETPYTYIHPEYPGTLQLTNERLFQLFYNPKNTNGLTDEEVDEVLALPHESLIADLEGMALYETGCTCDEIPQARGKGEYYSPLPHIILFLGEVNGPNSLDVVLETLRQNDEYHEFHFGGIAAEVYIPTLYLLGQNELSTLMNFIQEPGLNSFSRSLIFPAVVQIARLQPERREEVIEWFRQVLLFYTEKIAETIYCDGFLAGMLTAELLNINAVELLPEIKALFATGLVDEMTCGSYTEVEKAMKDSSWLRDTYYFNIHERYRDLKSRK